MTKYLFWFSEFKTMVNFLNEGKNLEEIKTLNENENLFNTKTKNRGRIIYNAISVRISAIPQEFIIFFGETDISTQKLIAVTAVMATESLFFDFMHEVYRGKLILGEKTLTPSDFSQFFKNKQIQDEKIASWTDTTLDRLGRTYRNVLLKSNLIKLIKKKEWAVEKPVINRHFAELMQKSKMSAFYSALSGGAK